MHTTFEENPQVYTPRRKHQAHPHINQANLDEMKFWSSFGCPGGAALLARPSTTPTPCYGVLSGMFLKERLTEKRWAKRVAHGLPKTKQTSLTCKPISFIQYLVNQPIIIWEKWTWTLLKASRHCRSLKTVIYPLNQQTLRATANRSCDAPVHTPRRHHMWTNSQKLLQATA
jgi:hypothetical protein